MLRETLEPKIGLAYEVLHGNWISFEDLNVSSEKLWNTIFSQMKKIIENDKKLKKPKNIYSINAISDETKKEICSAFTEDLNRINTLVMDYSSFFHKLVYHLRYKEHVANPKKIGPPESMRTVEMVTNSPILPHISETDQIVLTSLHETLNRMLELFVSKK